MAAWRALLFVAYLAAGTGAVPGLEFRNAKGESLHKERIELDETGRLTVPQHCRLEDCAARDQRLAALENALQLQGAENAALRKLLTALAANQTAANDGHAADLAKLQSEYQAADDELERAINKVGESGGAATQRLNTTVANLLKVGGHASAEELKQVVDARCRDSRGNLLKIGERHTSTSGCKPGCSIPHPCLQKPYGGWTEEETTKCFGADNKENVFQDHNANDQWRDGHSTQGYAMRPFLLQRRAKCSSFFTNWGRPGESYGRTRPGTYLNSLASSIDGHWKGGSAHNTDAAQLDGDKDGWGLCTGSGTRGASSGWKAIQATGKEETKTWDYCSSISLDRTDANTCLRDGQVRSSGRKDGRNWKGHESSRCTGPVIESPLARALYGPFVVYRNKGPMANARAGNARRYFDGNCENRGVKVQGLEAAKEKCRMEPLCGGVFRNTDWPKDEYCVNKGSPSTYPGPYGDTIGSWGHTFPTDSGWDLWHRQGYTLYDLLGMCAETEGCECVQVDNVESGGGYSNGRQWSMHRSTATAAKSCDGNCAQYAATLTSKDATLPEMVPTPSTKLTVECQKGARAPDTGALLTTLAEVERVASGDASDTCIPNCE